MNFNSKKYYENCKSVDDFLSIHLNYISGVIPCSYYNYGAFDSGCYLDGILQLSARNVIVESFNPGVNGMGMLVALFPNNLTPQPQDGDIVIEVKEIGSESLATAATGGVIPLDVYTEIKKKYKHVIIADTRYGEEDIITVVLSLLH